MVPIAENGQSRWIMKSFRVKTELLLLVTLMLEKLEEFCENYLGRHI